MKSYVIAIAASAALFLAGSASAQEYTLKYSFADVDQPTENAAAAHAYVFKDTLERLSGGRMKVDLFPNGQLGDAKSMAGGVERSTIPTMAGMVAALSGLFANTYLQRITTKEQQLLTDQLTSDQ